MTLNLLDSQYWGYGLGIANADLPNKGNPSEKQYYDASQITFNAAGVSFSASPCAPHECSDGIFRSIRSGAAHTLMSVQPSSTQTLKFRFKVSLPSESSAWPAIWLLPSWQQMAKTQAYNEIDIVEYVKPKYNAHVATQKTGTKQLGPLPYSVSNPTQSHEYGLDWSKDTLTFYQNGKVTTVTGSGGPYVPKQPLLLVINLAMTDDTKPASMLISTATLDF